MGAVVVGVPTTFQIPLSGHFSPVFAVVPIGFLLIVSSLKDGFEMSEFGLEKSFDIDNGELDNCSSEQCFVLGYELAQVDNLLSLDEAIHKPVNADNRTRIESACQDSGRPYQLRWLPGDRSESWMLLDVPRRAA